MQSPSQIISPAATRLSFWVRIIGAALLALTAAGCFSDKIMSKDFSGFEAYAFKQTAALGFCANPDQAFTAKLTRGDDGTMSFAYSRLELVESDRLQCGGDIDSLNGCLRPKSQPIRELKPTEIARVDAVFQDVSFFKKPDPICRDMGIDPCMIERHAWDTTELSDFICGTHRLSDDESADIRSLLNDLQAGD